MNKKSEKLAEFLGYLRIIYAEIDICLQKSEY